MGYQRKKWPDYAGDYADHATDILRQIDGLCAAATVAAAEEESPTPTVQLLTTTVQTVRSLAMDARELIVRARTGNYL
jgi:hypothetical protein